MTRKQSWAIFCATGLDIRGLMIGRTLLDELFTQLDEGKLEEVQTTLLNMGAKGKPKKPAKDWEPIWQKAYEAGVAAGQGHEPKPMGVVDTLSGQNWIVSEGVCGFAEIKVKGNTSFGRWAKKHAGFKKGYPQGLYFWVSAFGQSYERKVAFAKAAVAVLNENGIDDAYYSSRLD